MKTVSVDKPWLMPEVIDWLAMVVTSQMTVLETGVGGSTVFLASRAGVLISYEHDRAWAQKVQPQLDQRYIRNVVLHHAPNYPTEGIANCPTLDLALIDGRGRVRCCGDAWPALRSGGWLILDDSDRERYAEARAMLDASCAAKIVFRSGPDETSCWRKP